MQSKNPSGKKGLHLSECREVGEATVSLQVEHIKYGRMNAEDER